jgi:hypothetical protein
LRSGRTIRLWQDQFGPEPPYPIDADTLLKAYYQRLIAKGKEPKVAIIACMRKLIVILNTMLARDETWNPPSRAAA